MRDRTCTQCGAAFRVTFESSAQRYCSLTCAGKARHTRHETPCANCGQIFRPSPSNKAGRYCSKECYWQAKRGTRLVEHARGYRMVRRPEHPLAPPSGSLPVSRIVLYEKIGPGPHACHWCAKPIDWIVGVGPAATGGIIADHLDWDPSNDTPKNLVPSCNPCNGHRTREHDRRLLQPGEPTILVNGRPTRAVERTCEDCGTVFLALPAHVAKGNARFCSPKCHYASASH